MARSLRWRLQAWHAAMLFVVLAIFGAVVYRLQWTARLQQIDAELDQAADVLTSRLRRLAPFPNFRFPGRPPGGGGGPRGERSPANDRAGDVATSEATRPAPSRSEPARPERTRSDFRRPESSRPGSSRPGSSRPGSSQTEPYSSDIADLEPAVAEVPGEELSEAAPESRRARRVAEADSGAPRPWPWTWPWNGQRGGTPPNLELPDEFTQRFASSEPSPWYYLIWDRDGKLLAKSDAAPDVAFPNQRLAEGGIPVQTVRERDGMREVVHVSRFEMNVLVGRSIADDVRAHRGSGYGLTGVGLAVWAVGLVGGWWSTARAMRPIAAMTRAAEEISDRNLSRRIDVAATDDELGQLAAVLNGAFDRLEEAVERQTQFTADASHELRTPVAVMLASADFALSRPRDAAHYREALESCRRASHRMKTLIERLLTLARFDADEPALTLEPVDPTRLARETATLLAPLAEARRITLGVEGESVVIQADRERLGEVITNLIANAIHYNRDGGRVRVALRRDGAAHVVLSVADEGIGIPSEHLPQLFERFYRVDKARSRVDGGSGLGLAICRAIVTAHGGTIDVHSEPGAGTTFDVRLPIERAGPCA